MVVEHVGVADIQGLITDTLAGDGAALRAALLRLRRRFRDQPA